jgi:uncharacterized phage protein gp47/JayE
MPSYIKKNKTEMLREALNKLRNQTSITATGAGSIARALTEVVTSELGDMYDILDFNISQTLLTTATGTALDSLGELYGLRRNTVNELATIDKQLGSFQFYLSTSIGTDFTIPAGTNIYTNANSYIGKTFSYSTTEEVIIPAGRIRAYASIKPNFIDSVYTAGPNTLTVHDMTSPIGATLFCTNPKSIAPQPGLETDENYRLRIMKGIRIASSGTIEAVRFAGLGVQGVRDIKIRQAPYGMGSFEAIIVPETSNTSTNTILKNAEIAMDAVRPVGVRMYIKSPTRIPINLEVQLVAPGANTDRVRTVVPNRANVGIRRYINSLLPGDTLIYNRLIQIILDSSEIVRDVVVKSFEVNGTEVLRRNYQPADDEQLIIGDIIVTIASS